MYKETLNSNSLMCPYCGYLHRDTFEIFTELEECIDEFECGHCGGVFTATREASITYKGIPNES